MFNFVKKYVPVLALIIFTSIQAAAMPAHPGNTNPTGRERPPAVQEAEAPLYSPLFKSSSAQTRSAPSTGTVKVLVILADFGTDVAGLPLLTAPDSGTDNYSITGFLHPLPYALFAIIILLSGLLIKTLRIPLLAFSFVIISGCNTGDSIDYGDPLYFKTSSPSIFYTEMLETGSGLTMTDYYSAMSNGNLDLTFDVAGPYRVSKGWQYYGENDSTGYDMYPATFVGEAVDLAQKDGVDFSLYDNDGNGYVDAVIVIHAGMGEEFAGDADTIWSHYWNLSTAAQYRDGSGKRYYDGVYIDYYTIQPEYNLTPGDSTIGVFCHEFGHVLGLPDLYDTSGETNGVGRWSLMSSGSWGSGDGEDPAPLLAWERDRVGGATWVTITEASSGPNDIDEIETGKIAYKVTIDSGSGQYLMLERKSAASGTSPFVPAPGILITHIHEYLITSYLGDNYVNAGSTRVHGVNIIEAANTNASGLGSLWTKSIITLTDYSKMPFPYGAIDSLAYSDDGSTQPNANYYMTEAVASKTGNPLKSITGITASSFTVNP